jgi:hypothetical protein
MINFETVIYFCKINKKSKKIQAKATVVWTLWTVDELRLNFGELWCSGMITMSRLHQSTHNFCVFLSIVDLRSYFQCTQIYCMLKLTLDARIQGMRSLVFTGFVL